ncbi:helicase SRCAP isoform X1 [Gadus morhua]|uniref:helicase SRCAP isoform X1 n=2 Tax=Gadus morhua TaxID=8049 RepID=UPI0011B46055|nr:helicase SRCAP-like isoform X1 [Gadus morhua]XP_030194238.1 helicase SRCAP-like isoform X1 [Gadus morhua]
MEYHASGSLPLLARPRFCPGANANGANGNGAIVNGAGTSGGYLCETGHCCGESGCCTYYYELWWFWLLWSALILFSCCCAYRHRRAKLRVQQQQRQTDISLLAYHGATAYPASMLDLSFLASLKLPSYEEIAAQPSTPPPPYSSVFTSPRYPQPPTAPDPHLLTHHQRPQLAHCSDMLSSLSSDNSSSCSCDSCCPSSPCSSSLSVNVTYETDTSHASTPCGVPPLPLHVTAETVASEVALEAVRRAQSMVVVVETVAVATADPGDNNEGGVSGSVADEVTVTGETAASVTTATGIVSSVAPHTPGEDDARTASPIMPQSDLAACVSKAIVILTGQNPGRERACPGETVAAEGLPAPSPDLVAPLNPSPDPNHAPTISHTPNLNHTPTDKAQADPNPTPILRPTSDPSPAPNLSPAPGRGEGPPSIQTCIPTSGAEQHRPASPPSPPSSPPPPVLLLAPTLDSLLAPPVSRSAKTSLSPSPRPTHSATKQTLFSPCVDVYEAGPPSWGRAPGGDQEEEEEEQEEEEGRDEDDVGADESQYRHRRLTGDSGIEVCRCRMEEEEEEEEEEDDDNDDEEEEKESGGGGGGKESLRSGGEGGRQGSDVTVVLHDSADCPARALVPTPPCSSSPNATPTSAPLKDPGEVIIVVETV